jgi:hypothetical protein
VATDEEAAVISAAIEHLWPRVVVVLPDHPTNRPTGWRFSGRWWSRPVPARRERPWV